MTQVVFPIFEGEGSASVHPKYRNRSAGGQWGQWLSLAHSDTASDFLAHDIAASGTLTVGGKHVVRTVNGFSANSSGEVTIPNFEQDGVKPLGGVDYNTITEPGFYSCTASGSTNGPGSARKLLVLGNSGAKTYVTQIAFPITKGVAIAIRYLDANGDWTEWLKVGTEGAGFVDPSPSSNDDSIPTTRWVNTKITESRPKAYITETFKSGTSWYRKWSDGFIEQGGYVDSPYAVTIKVTLHVNFSDTNYTVVLGVAGGSESTARVELDGKTTSYFSSRRYYSGSGKGSGKLYWEAKGY